MKSRPVAAFVAVVLAFASCGVIAATFGLCHKASCCPAGQQVSAPPKCCNEAACEAAPEVAEAAHATAALQQASFAAVAILTPAPRHAGSESPSIAAVAAPSRLAFIVVLRI